LGADLPDWIRCNEVDIRQSDRPLLAHLTPVCNGNLRMPSPTVGLGALENPPHRLRG